MTKVVICGAPSSGNRLVQLILQKAGADVHVNIAHYPIAIRQQAAQGVRHFVLMVRSDPFWDESIDRSPDRRSIIASQVGTATDKGLHAHLLSMAMGALGSIRPAVVTYEGLVAHPEAVCRYLYDFCGLEVPDPVVPVEIYDANLGRPPVRATPGRSGPTQTIMVSGFKVFHDHGD